MWLPWLWDLGQRLLDKGPGALGSVRRLLCREGHWGVDTGR